VGCGGVDVGEVVASRAISVKLARTEVAARMYEDMLHWINRM